MAIGGLAHAPTDRSALDRLFSRNALNATYGAANKKGTEEPEPARTIRDKVELSANVPKQVDAGLFADAKSTAAKMARGHGLSADEANRLRADPAFASTVALFTVHDAAGAAEAAAPPGDSITTALADAVAQYYGNRWPADVDTPSARDLSSTMRRLTQRLSGDGGGEVDAAALESSRGHLLDRFRNADYPAVATALADTVAVAV